MLNMDLGALGLSPLLVGLKQVEIEALLSLALKEGYAPGEVVVEEGTPGDTMYMVKSGGVAVHKTEKQGKEIQLASLESAGDFFGEMVFVDVMPRSATVRANSACELLAFPLNALKEFFVGHPDAHLAIVLNIARVLSKRLRDADEVIVELKTGGDLG